MTVEDASLAVQTNYEASDGAHAPHFDASQHSQASGSFQVPDSDDHELLEQLAERQEQEYWSMMGDECTAGSLHSSSSASSTPVVTSRRVRTRSPLVYDPDRQSPAVNSSSLSPLYLRQTPSQSGYFAQQDPILTYSPLQRSPSMSPDPLSLHYARDTSTQIRERPIHTEWNPDEGYQTKTDSDHVTSFVDVSAEPCTRGRHADTSTNGPGFLPSNLHDLSSPSTAPSPHVEAPENDRQLSSPLSSPTGSPGAQSTGSLLRPLSANKPTSAQKATRETATNEPQRPDDKGGAPVRQLRQRKAVQLAPYSTEFSKFASLANKNSWEGIISAGLKEAFLEKERAKAESQKRQRDLSDEWLVHGNEDEEEQEADFSEPSSGPSSPRRQRRSTPAVNAELITHPSASSEKYSRSRREREWDPIANRLKAARKPSDVYRRVVRSSHPSSSRITIEDLERSAIRRASRRSEKRASNNETVKAVKHADTAARAAQVSKARKAGLLPSDVESSSSERENRSSRKRQATSQARPSADGSAAAVTTVIESSETDESVSDRPLGSDSPDRPIATRKDRFTLKGKRKRAAMFMMPAVALKKAEADLRLMEREMAEGKQIRLEELDDDEATNDAVPKSAKAKKRWRPQNTNRPFRYVTELSTDESDSGASRDGSPADDDDETQAAMHVWANMAAGKTQAAQDTSNQYWDKVIGRILLRRDRKARTAATRRRRKPGKKSDRSGKEHQQPADDGRRSFKPPSRSKQSTIAQHFVAPVYLDTADRLFEHCRSQSAVNRVAPRSKDQSKAFWRVLAGPTSTLSHVSEAVSTKATAEVVDTPTAASVHTPIGCLSENTDATSKFARFSFDYNIERLPAGLKFASSSYLAAGCLHEHLCHLKGEPTFSVPDPVAPFGIRLDNAMSSEVLLQILPRLMDCMYEYTIGEIASVNLHGSVNQALRFLGYYGLVWHFQDSAYATVRSAIFEQLSSLETRLDTYLAEVDDVDSILSSSMIAIKWAMFEITTLAYAVIYRHADAASKEAARHHILETMTYLVQSLLQSSPAKLASKLREITSLDQSDDVQILVEDIYCETWVCLINVCTVTQNIAGYEFLSLGSFWHTVEHCLNEAAIEQSLHPIVRGEASSFVAMLLCAISQFNASGESIATPQMSAHWPIISQALDNIKSQDFAHAYSAMSSPNRARISRYIWTVFARILHMSTRWEWPILDQGKLVGKMFDILDSRQLQDFTIEGEADFPAFLSNFSGKISTEIDHDDTVFHLFLRILSQAAFECNRQNDRKSTMTLARIAMRIMPMREYLQYGRHNITGKNLDRSVLVNHCALLIVLAIVDPSTAERRFAKLKTVLDFAGSDARARQDYLKAIMFIGIVYKVRGIDLSPVLSWLSHTADYLCSSYSQCAKRRAALLAVKRKAGSNLKNGQHHSSTTVLKHASAPLPDVTVDMEIQLVNRDMAEMAVMEGLLLGAVQQIMLVKPADDATITVTYPCLDYLNTAWTTQVLSSPMVRDPVAGSQVLQCIQQFLQLRNECVGHTPQWQQVESQDEFGDMDFDFDDPALNAMLGVPEEQASVGGDVKKAVDLSQLDRQFIELVKTSIAPRLYAILSDLSVIESGRDSGVPDLTNKAGYIDSVAELWALCAVVLVQKNQRDWSCYMEPFGKESWHRFANVLRRWEIACTFSCLMLANDGKAYKLNRNVLLHIFFRRLAAPTPSARDAQLLCLLLNADPSFILWQNLPFHRDDLVNAFVVDSKDLTASRTAIFRAIFSTCKKIFARQFVTVQDIERSSPVVCREQQINDQLLYSYLGTILSSMRDFLDSTRSAKAADGSLKEYAAHCRQVIFLMKEEIGSSYVSEQNIPALRLLAGVVNGTGI